MKRGLLIGVILIGILAVGAQASMFGWWADLFADPIAPELISSQADPIKVMPGDNLRIYVEVRADAVAETAVANFNHENGFDVVSLTLINHDKSTNKQTYLANWEVHDTLDQVWYTTDYELTFANNQVLSGSVDWQDPTVSHSTSQILPGTFSEGNFIFNGSLDVDSVRQKGSTTLSNSITGNAATASDLSCSNCIGGTEINEGTLTLPTSTLSCTEIVATNNAGSNSRSVQAIMNAAGFVVVGGTCTDVVGRFITSASPSGSNVWNCDSNDGAATITASLTARGSFCKIV